jgi:hypothetical protein
MSWKLILKASGCGCNDCKSVSKAKGHSAGGFKGNRRGRARGTRTTPSNTYEACISRLQDLYGMERITMDEYLEEKAKCKAKYGR